jgi:hypothetical protein
MTGSLTTSHPILLNIPTYSENVLRIHPEFVVDSNSNTHVDLGLHFHDKWMTARGRLRGSDRWD